jgi:hypothetical protein
VQQRAAPTLICASKSQVRKHELKAPREISPPLQLCEMVI